LIGAIAGTGPASERPAAAMIIARLEPPPDGASLLEARRADLSTSGDILESAQAVSQLVCRRTVILKAMSGLSQEPREITKLVVADPTLAGQVLKTVNSAFYGLCYPVASVFRAVLLLGHLEVRNIIWRSCLSEGLGADQGPTREALDTLWQHSFATSRVAYALAKSLNLPAPDDVSTAALLHDIGKVFCLKTKPLVGMALYSNVGFSNLPKLTRELAELGMTHAALGGEIARVWGLPDESRAAIGLHHMPSYVDPSEIDGDPRAVAVICLADVLCHGASKAASEGGNHSIYLPRQAWLKTLRVSSGIEGLCTESVLQALSRPTPAAETAGARMESAYPD
jgi:putative nucleotidyltransferase with HDIG domain